jgi:ribonuclease HI
MRPRKVGGGGVLLDPTRKIILSYTWGLGHNSNNIAEILALWKGLSQARGISFSKLAVIGDSRVIIQALSQKKRPNNFLLAHYYTKINSKVVEFEEIKFFHIIRNLNQLADHEANVGASLRKGVIIVNGDESFCPIL